jgi:dTMP kinase
MPRKKGRFVVLDGPDGGGKSTQVALLRDALVGSGREVLVTREPGGTAIGEKIRGILLDPAHHQMTARAELFLYMASRSQLVEEVILPAVRKGAVVVCDRFLSASVAYQGAAGGLGTENVAGIGQFCIGDAQPDLTLVLDVDFDTSLRRRGTRTADRIEQRDRAYHERVRKGFLALAESDPARYKVVDAKRGVEDVHKAILELVTNVL